MIEKNTFDSHAQYQYLVKTCRKCVLDSHFQLENSGVCVCFVHLSDCVCLLCCGGVCLRYGGVLCVCVPFVQCVVKRVCGVCGGRKRGRRRRKCSKASSCVYLCVLGGSIRPEISCESEKKSSSSPSTPPRPHRPHTRSPLHLHLLSLSPALRPTLWSHLVVSVCVLHVLVPSLSSCLCRCVCVCVCVSDCVCGVCTVCAVCTVCGVRVHEIRI